MNMDTQMTKECTSLVQLCDAIKDNDAKIYNEALEALKNPSRLDWQPHSNSPLHVAVKYSRIELIKDLIQNRGFNPEALVANHGTALWCAASMNAVMEAKVLLNLGAKTNCKFQNQTPFQIAVKNGNLEIVEMIMSQNSTQINFEPLKENYHSALKNSILYGFPDKLIKLIEFGKTHKLDYIETLENSQVLINLVTSGHGNGEYKSCMNLATHHICIHSTPEIIALFESSNLKCKENLPRILEIILENVRNLNLLISKNYSSNTTMNTTMNSTYVSILHLAVAFCNVDMVKVIVKYASKEHLITHASMFKINHFTKCPRFKMEEAFSGSLMDCAIKFGNLRVAYYLNHNSWNFTINSNTLMSNLKRILTTFNNSPRKYEYVEYIKHTGNEDYQNKLMDILILDPENKRDGAVNDSNLKFFVELMKFGEFDINLHNEDDTTILHKSITQVFPFQTIKTILDLQGGAAADSSKMDLAISLGRIQVAKYIGDILGIPLPEELPEINLDELLTNKLFLENSRNNTVLKEIVDEYYTYAQLSGNTKLTSMAPIIIAADHNVLLMRELMIKSRINVNEKWLQLLDNGREWYCPPLHYFICRRNPTAVDVLMIMNANPTLKGIFADILQNVVIDALVIAKFVAQHNGLIEYLHMNEKVKEYVADWRNINLVRICQRKVIQMVSTL